MFLYINVNYLERPEYDISIVRIWWAFHSTNQSVYSWNLEEPLRRSFGPEDYPNGDTPPGNEFSINFEFLKHLL